MKSEELELKLVFFFCDSINHIILKTKMKLLIKYSIVEFGETWWFLNEVFYFQHFDSCTTKTMLKVLTDIKCARFIKRYSSEEELNIDVDLNVVDYEMKCVD